VLEARYRQCHGEWRWLRSESQPRWDPTGKHIGFIGVAHDITAAKQAEIDLRRLNETLELRISERTAQLESNEAQMRAIFETSHQYQALLNHHGDVLHANRTALADIRAEAPTSSAGRSGRRRGLPPPSACATPFATPSLWSCAAKRSGAKCCCICRSATEI
jgi:PAS domain S-box